MHSFLYAYEGVEYSCFLLDDANGLTIFPAGAISGTDILKIPEQIDGCPVTSFIENPLAKIPGLDNIKTIVVPENIEEIGDFAFAFCDSLERVCFGAESSLKRIGQYAFMSCPNLKFFNIPDSVESIEASAFNKDPIEEITFGKNVSVIKPVVDSVVSTLKEINVSPENKNFYSEGNCVIERETGSVVAGCKSSVIPVRSDVVSVETEAFKGVEFNHLFTIPENIKKIEPLAFADAKGLAALRLPKGIEQIGDFAFVDSDIRAVKTGKNLKYLGRNAFLRCHNLRRISLQESQQLDIIHGAAFADCKNAEILTFPPELKQINTGAFQGCEHLTECIVPCSLDWVGSDAFRGCKKLEQFIGLRFTKVTEIKAGTFAGCSNLATIALPDKVQEIEVNAFNGCERLEHIVFPSNLSVIAINAFCGSGLREVVFPSSVKTVNGGFEKCGNLAFIRFPDHVKYVDRAAFRDSGEPGQKLDIVIPESVDTINMDFVQSLKGDTTVHFMGDVTFAEYNGNKFSIPEHASLTLETRPGASLFMVPVSGRKTKGYWDASEKRRALSKLYTLTTAKEEPRSVDKEIADAKAAASSDKETKRGRYVDLSSHEK